MRILSLVLLVGVVGGVSAMERTMMDGIPFSGIGNSFFPTSKKGEESTSKKGEIYAVLLSNPLVFLHNSTSCKAGYKKVSHLKQEAFSQIVNQVDKNIKVSDYLMMLGYFKIKLNDAKVEKLSEIDGVNSIGKFKYLNIPKLLAYRKKGNTELKGVFKKGN